MAQMPSYTFVIDKSYHPHMSYNTN